MTDEDTFQFQVLPEMKLEELQKKLEETIGKIQSGDKTLWRLHDLYEIELIRREHKLQEKTIPELEEIANEAYRKARRMQNYDWDVVETSDEDNRRGFMSEIDFLESLESAANLEIERRMRASQTNSG